MHKYKFVSWEANDAGDSFINEEYVNKLYKEDNVYLWHADLLKQGIIKRGGYCYDFTDSLKKFVYKTNFGIQEGYAPNKTLLRKTVHAKCEYIMEVQK